MENEFYTDEFELLIKEKADQFRMYPSKRVWHSIYNNLHPSRRWPSVVMSIFLITSLMLIGHLNTGDNSITRQINNNSYNETYTLTANTTNSTKKHNSNYSRSQHQPAGNYEHAFEDVITNETDYQLYTIVKSNRPRYFNNSTTPVNSTQTIADNSNPAGNTGKDLVQSMDSYIKSNQLMADANASGKKNKNSNARPKATATDNFIDDNDTEALSLAAAKARNAAASTTNADTENTEADKKETARISATANKKTLTDEEKAWIENFSLLSKSEKNKWKERLAINFYATPAVNYRKLSTASKGSATPFANADINNVISQKPGFGIETGLGLTYAFAKRLQLRAGFQFNYTNYNINADETNHPITTTILLNDPSTGYSYSSARTTTTTNAYNSTALQPVTLHNRTYQISIPVGFAYKLSSQRNVDWFAGASLQPTYVFGGNAHILSTDLKSYISEPSSINSWNLNLGFETFMNFKLGTYNLQVGPQVRYQVNSTYRKNVALIEKPYAVGLKFGLIKGF